MLELVSISHHLPRRGTEPLTVLDSISFRVPGGHLLGLLGATGSGKSALLRIMSGLQRAQAGAVLWHGRDVTQNLWRPNEMALVTNDESALISQMNVKEHLVAALLLQVGGISRRDAVVKAEKVALLCGLDTVHTVCVMDLTVPQRRRLALAIALAGDPLLVLCDDFMAGIDPKSQRELAALLQLVAKESPYRVVINATQSLADLQAYDTVIVMNEGRVCFHGPGRAITHYFSIPHTEDLYLRLAKRPSTRWQDSWNRHRDSYYAAFKLLAGPAASESELAAASDDDEDGKKDDGRLRLGRGPDPEVIEEKPEIIVPLPAARPGTGTQVAVLMRRRWTLFRRSKFQWWSQAALIIGLPLVIIAFSWGHRDALHQLHNPEWRPAGTQLPSLAAFAIGITLIQVLMITGLAVVNGAREIASERSIWQREHLSGVRSLSYSLSKVLFVGALLLVQVFGIGMVFDLVTSGLPGSGALRVSLLFFSAVAFNALVLGISAWSRTGDQAASRAWLLAFLQAPLSSAILALPIGLSTLLQPLTTAFYSWSGSMDTLKHSALFEGITAANATWFAAPSTAIFVLIGHALVGLALLSSGLRRA